MSLFTPRPRGYRYSKMAKNSSKNTCSPGEIGSKVVSASPANKTQQFKKSTPKVLKFEASNVKRDEGGRKLQKSFVPAGKKDNKVFSPPKPKSAKKRPSSVSKLETSTIKDESQIDDINKDQEISEENNARKKIIMKRKGENTCEGNDKPKSKKQKLDEMSKKERKLERKKTKNNFELSMQAKKIWGTLRQASCPKPKKLELSNELYILIKGKVKELAVAHDTSRVIQSLIAHGSTDIKAAIFDELKEEIFLLMKSVYANQIVMKLLKEGTKVHKKHIIELMYGKVTSLMRHKVASKVVEYAYNEAATNAQKMSMVIEFYGPAYAVFKDDGVSSLDEILKRDPLQKDVILSHLKETLSSFIEKSLIRHSITHRVLHEYLLHCSVKDRTEMIESLRNYVVEILHTNDGASAAMQCVWHGTNKDRKVIIKSMKTHVSKICREQYGHKVLLAIFDNVDDTKLVVDAILKEMMTCLLELCDDTNGRRVLIHILAPRQTTYFHPSVIDMLKQGDGNATSKKDVDVRSKELHSFASPHIVKIVTENLDKFAHSPMHFCLIKAVTNHASGISDLHAKFVEILNNTETSTIFDDSLVYHMLKHLIRVDGEKFKKDNDDDELFANVLLKTMSDDDMNSWIESNRGAFALLMLLETEIPTIVERISHFLKQQKGELASKPFKGAELLLKKVNS